MKGKELFEELGNVREDFIQDAAKSLYGEEEREEDTGEGKAKLSCLKGGKRGRRADKMVKEGKRKHRYLPYGVVAAVFVLLFGALGMKKQFANEARKSAQSSDVLQKELAASEITGKEGQEQEQEPSGGDNTGGVKKGGISTGVEPVKYQVQSVSYPESVDTMNDEEWEPDSSYLKSLKNFYQEAFRGTLLSEKKENTACSPVNLYFIMAMLTEMTSGETQEELLEALGQSAVQTVREQSRKIWNIVYEDTEISKCILGNSLWLNKNISYQPDVLETVADNYYASTYQGEMGTASMDKTIQDWVNKMTGNVLEEQAKGITTSKNTAAVLLSSANFYAQWGTPFPEKNTKKAVFYNADGSKVNCDFMKRTVMGSYIYRRDDFTAVPISFEESKEMWIFLPNEGVSVDNLLEEDMGEVLQIVSDTTSKEGEWAEVTIKLPKFQIDTGEVDLIPAMKEMGVESLFHEGDADFSQLVGDTGQEQHTIYANKAVQASKVGVDENGCSVASYTEVELRDGSALPEKKYTMNCNRPFLFVIGDIYYGIPVFAGVVNEMTE